MIGGACQNPGDLPDAEKRARIEELYESYRGGFPDAPEITVEALVRELAGPEPPVLVDVRSDDEREVSTLPGAISQKEFEKDPDRFAGREVVTYCTIGYRSGRYTEKLVAEGVATPTTSAAASSPGPTSEESSTQGGYADTAGPRLRQDVESRGRGLRGGLVGTPGMIPAGGSSAWT